MTRPFSAGTLALCRKLGLTMILGSAGDKAALPDEGKQRQIAAFLHIQRAPIGTVKKAGTKRTGRVNPAALKQPYRVNRSALLALQRRLLKGVGWLPAGWNEAALKLGVRLPAWVSRHGTGRGSIAITRGGSLFRITIANAGKSAEDVGPAIAKMQRSLAEGKGADLIEKMGIDMDEMKSKTPATRST